MNDGDEWGWWWWVIKREDAADDAAEGPQADDQSNPEHLFGVYVWLHAVWDDCMYQDVERPHTKRHPCAHQVHREQCCFLHPHAEREKGVSQITTVTNIMDIDAFTI